MKNIKEDNVKWDHPEEMESKGSILLVHGTAAMNLNGNIPGVRLEQYPLGAMSLYEKLSKDLTGHVPNISLDEVEGVVIIGGLSTKRFHNALMMAKSLEEYNYIIS